MRNSLIKLAITFGLGCIVYAPAHAYNDDIHYEATFVLAVALGFGWDRSLVVASANQAVDQNVFTKPTEHLAWKSPVAANEVRQLELLGLSMGLSLQDYVFHCFSPNSDRRGERHQLVLDNMDRLEKSALASIEKRNASGRAEDELKALVAIGVYLHCQQDSWSHSGYGGNPLGHTIDNAKQSSPDDTGRYPEITKRALAETLEKLKVFVTQLGIPVENVSNEELAQLFTGLTGGRLTASRSCNSKISEYWLKKRIDAHPSSDTLRVVQSNTYTFTITSIVTKQGPGKDGRWRSIRSASNVLVDVSCQEIFLEAFPEIKSAHRVTHQVIGTNYIATEWADPVTLAFLRLPSPKPPLLKVDISVSPTFTKEHNGYDPWRDGVAPP